MDGRILPVSPKLSLTFNGKELDLKLFSVEEIESRHALNQIPETRLVISGVEADIYTLFTPTQPGVDAKITLKIDSTTFRLFSGEVFEQTLSLEREAARLTLQLRHPLHRLTRTLKTQVYTDQSDLEIVKRLLKVHGLSLKKASGLNYKHSQLVQFQCSDWQFLQYRLKANNVWLNVEGEDIDIIPASITSGPVPASHIMKRPDNTSNAGIVSARWQRSVPVFDDVNVAVWEVDKQKMSSPQKPAKANIATGKLADITKATGGSAELRYGLSLEADEIKACTDALETERHMTARQIHFQVWGRYTYLPGEVISIEGFAPGMNGNAILSEVRHRILPERWETELRVGLTPGDTLRALTPMISGLHLGVIADYAADKKSWFRLPIKLPTFGQEDVLWARMALPHASDKAALGFYPNPGDEVVVAFVEGDARYPVVLGALHNPKKPAPAQFDINKLRDEKYIVMGEGDNLLTLLLNGKKNSLTLSHAEASLLINKDGIALAAKKEVTVTANDKTRLMIDKSAVKIEKADNVTISSKKIEMKK